MPQQVNMGAQMTCTFGMAPSALIVTPEKKVLVEGPPAANIMDFAPMKNIPPFGMCNSVANPTVAAATAAALGVLTPMPCLPVTTPWKPGAATVLIGNLPALDNVSTCNCAWGGVITFVRAGTTRTMVP
ncbi:MAG: DUF4280 domain-containing protein [Burkholderiales bacterium]